jgi:hypothetical protein
MSKQLENMPPAQFNAEYAMYKAEAARRIRDLAELMGLAQPVGKRGRPSSNPLAALLGGVDQETDEEPVSIAAE